VPRIHFQLQLAELKDKLLAMAALAQQSVESGLEAYVHRDKGLCKFVKQNERAVDTAQRELDEMAYELLAKEQPMAIDLRFILAVIKINGDLERIGDQAMSIVRRTKEILPLDPVDLPVDFVDMGEYAARMIRSAVQALLDGDARLADSIREMDDEIDRMNRRAHVDLLRVIQERPQFTRQAMNGILVAVGRIQPILVTLASLSIWAGAALFVLPQPGGAIPQGFSAVLAGNAWQLVPAAAFTLLVVAGFWSLFRRTGLAVALYAVGDDERSARANGVPVVTAKIAAYTLSGLFSALAGLYLSAVTTSGDATTGAVYTLTSIAAVVLGGVSLFGGRGSAAGSMAGAFVLTLIVNILFSANINPLLQEFFQGLVLILAMAASVLVNLLLARST